MNHFAYSLAQKPTPWLESFRDELVEDLHDDEGPDPNTRHMLHLVNEELRRRPKEAQVTATDFKLTTTVKTDTVARWTLDADFLVSLVLDPERSFLIAPDDLDPAEAKITVNLNDYRQEIEIVATWANSEIDTKGAL